MAYEGINLDYNKILAVVALMNSAHDQIVPTISNLRNRVNLLVEDGMVFQQSSETIRNTYTQFDTSLQAAVKGINDFAQLFQGIKKNAEEFDHALNMSLQKK